MFGSRTGSLKVVTLCVLGIQDRHDVGGIFRRAEQRAIGVDVRVAPIRRDQVMQILFLGVPLPGRDHDVALDALRALRLVLRQLALGDAVGPVGVVSERRPAEVRRRAG